MSSAALGLVVLHCIRKQADQAERIKPASTIPPVVCAFYFSSCLQILALGSCLGFKLPRHANDHSRKQIVIAPSNSTWSLFQRCQLGLKTKFWASFQVSWPHGRRAELGRRGGERLTEASLQSLYLASPPVCLFAHIYFA